MKRYGDTDFCIICKRNSHNFFPKYLVDGSNTCFPLHCISVCLNHQLCLWSEWSVLSE